MFWRAAAGLSAVDGPEPSLFEPGLRARPCVLDPVRQVEYPNRQELPEGLVHNGPETERATKVGGWTFWYASDPVEMECVECGAPRRLLLSLNSADPAGWEFSGDCAFNVVVCSADVRHSLRLHVD